MTYYELAWDWMLVTYLCQEPDDKPLTSARLAKLVIKADATAKQMCKEREIKLNKANDDH